MRELKECITNNFAIVYLSYIVRAVYFIAWGTKSGELCAHITHTFLPITSFTDDMPW